MMIGAAIDDLRRRRVDNRWWLPFLGAAVVLDAQLLITHGLTSPTAMRVGLAVASCGLFYLMWRFRLFGGADAKGLMVLSLLVPVPLAEPSTLPAIDALTNGLLMALLIPVVLGLYNAVRGHFAFPAMVLGFRVSMATARKWKVWPLQRVEDGQVKWQLKRLLPAPGDSPWDALEHAGMERPWATPMVPFMVPLAAGALVAFAWGNLMVRLFVTMGLGAP